MKNEKVYNFKKRSFLFSLQIIRFLKNLPRNNFIVDTLSKQLLRSATSIGANIIEAQAAPSKKDFANFYNISLKSANETKYWLLLLDKSNIGDKQKINNLLEEAKEISNILGKSLLTMRGK
ncbi:MAG: four helix bundle protein [Patescibacteria group bacterium]|nr:four helix bundle protein [Patescibacteria group bacterium]